MLKPLLFLLQIFQADGTSIYNLSDSDVLKHRLPCTSLQFIPLRTAESDDKKNVLLATCMFLVIFNTSSIVIFDTISIVLVNTVSIVLVNTISIVLATLYL